MIGTKQQRIEQQHKVKIGIDIQIFADNSQKVGNITQFLS